MISNIVRSETYAKCVGDIVEKTSNMAKVHARYTISTHIVIVFHAIKDVVREI